MNYICFSLTTLYPGHSEKKISQKCRSQHQKNKCLVLLLSETLHVSQNWAGHIRKESLFEENKNTGFKSESFECCLIITLSSDGTLHASDSVSHHPNYSTWNTWKSCIDTLTCTKVHKPSNVINRTRWEPLGLSSHTQIKNTAVTIWTLQQRWLSHPPLPVPSQRGDNSSTQQCSAKEVPKIPPWARTSLPNTGCA